MEKFNKPCLDIVEFENDIITTSGGTGEIDPSKGKDATGEQL